MKQIFVTGVIVGIVMLVIGLVASTIWGMVFPGIASEYQNPALFRPWSDPLMSLYFLHPFLVGFILTWLWHKTKWLFKTSDLLMRGMQFGLVYWLITLPGMLISYASFPISLLLVLSWTISGLGEVVAAGIVLAKREK